MSPLAPAIFIFEKSPRWEAEVKRRLADCQVLVRPCRSAADVLALCRQAPGSVAVVDLAAGVAEGLRLVEALAGLRLGISPVVIGSRATDELEWPARDLGATDYVTDCIGGDSLAEICRRKLHGVGTPTRSAREGLRSPMSAGGSR